AVEPPRNVVTSFQVTDQGQDGTGQPYEQGFAHLVVTAPSGVSFDAAGFDQIVWGLSNTVGMAWDSTPNTLAHNHIYATLRPDSASVADLYFPPVRDESPPSGSDSPTMLLRVDLPADDRVYVTPFVGGAWDNVRLTTPRSDEAAPLFVTTETELRAALGSEHPEYGTIDLPPNQTIVITQPLEFTHSVKIVGNNATLLFQQGETAAWPAGASGAIYVACPGYTNIQVELTGFTIQFDSRAPI